MPRKRKSKSAKKARSPDDGNVIHISHCQTVQVGQTNVSTVSAMEDDQAERQRDKTNTARSEKCMLVLKNILKDRQKPVPLEELHACTAEILEKGESKSFEELCQMSLKDFVSLQECFRLYEEKGILFVRLATNKSGAKKQIDPTNDSSIKLSDGSSDSAEDGGDWDKVTNKKKKKAKQIQDITHQHARDVTQRCTEVDPDVRKFKDLIAKKENRDLLFVADHSIYTENTGKCMQDIVAMWNTPQRTKSHIVIGVQNDEGILNLIGTDKNFDISMYEGDKLFSLDFFTMRPIYKVSTIDYDSKMFVILEIASSFGKCQPSIVKCNYVKQNVKLTVNELWYRIYSGNIVCPPTDPTTASIYQWFLGSGANLSTALLSNEVSVGVLPNEISDEEKKMAEEDTMTEEDKMADQLANTQATDQEEQCVPQIGKDFSDFWKFVNGFKANSSNILLSGDVSNRHRHLANLSFVDWIAVYDFDVYSCSNGLFNALQDSLESKRHLRIGTWKESPPFPTEDGTYWCFVRGRREIAASRTDSSKGVIESAQSWFKTAKSGLIDNCNQLATFSDDYTVFTIVILWPTQEDLAPFITRFLDRLVEILTHTPKIVLCLNEEPCTEMGQLQFKTLCYEYKSNIHICNLNFNQLCLGIGNHLSEKEPNAVQNELPISSSYSHLTPLIDEKDAVWIRDDLEVLYISNPYQKTADNEKLESEIMKFYKGGNLHWYARYIKEDDSIDIERDELKKLEEMIQNHLEDYRASVISIYHAPGSGGTTLAQKALWRFHKRIPCAQTRCGTLLKSKDLQRKISFLHDKTQLPVLLLIDGEDDTAVKYLANTLRYAIILCLKRFPWNMQRLCGKHQKDKIYLSGRVSAKEAAKLAASFGERCDATKQKRLNKMRDDIKQKKTHHFMYEFGMTVYHHEFKGIVSYVEGYLQLKDNPTVDLLPWQKCLGFLSLVYYYGHTSIPCQFFAALFGKPSDYSMSLDDDFPYPISEFVVYDSQEKKKNTIRICHYEIAKEILEQLLCRRTKRKAKACLDSMSPNACGNLADFCKEFIEYCRKKKNKHSAHCQTVKHILAKTFIHRDERYRGENEEQDTRKKQQVSQLLLDIPASKPLFSERLQILEKLSSSFPDDPNYHAHVGRFHAFCGPGNEKKAEDRFETAIKLCQEKNRGIKEEDLVDSMKSTLMHIYHMYGIVKKRRISTCTGRSQRDTAILMPTDSKFNDQLAELVETAEMACDFFTKSRELTPDACDIFIHAFTGEIEVRIQICDYITRHFKPVAEPDKIFTAFLKSTATDDSKYFVEISIQKIERLILECYMDVNLEMDDQNTLKRLVKWYNAIFRKQILPEESMTADDDVSNIRMQITNLKLNHGAHNLGIEYVYDEDAFNNIIRLYEQIFKFIQNRGTGETLRKKEIEYDYREWIYAIREDRCQKTYQIEEVLMHVQNWHHLVRSPMSTYYLFVLKSLLGFGTETTPGKTQSLLDAEKLKSELSKKIGLVIRPKYPREWLGSSKDGIKILQTANRRIGLSENRENVRELADLAVCKGTITHPNNCKFGGNIELDLQVSTVRVFYIPKRSNLEGPRYGGQRVEFNLAFSVEHGYEAFHVKLLKRHGCSSCSATIEFTSVDECLKCNCGEMIHKDHLNEVKSEHGDVLSSDHDSDGL